MAEIAVLAVINKIAIAVAEETLRFAKPLLSRKAELVAALPQDMNLIKNDLDIIRAFLKEINKKGWKDEVIETWIAQVRRLAYDMEDIADQFIYIVGKQNQKGSWWHYMKKVIKKPQTLFSLDEVANEVKRINIQLRQIKENKECWVKSIDIKSDIPAANYLSEQEIYLPGHDFSIKDDELVGIDKNRDTLIEFLQLEDSSRQILAVWGMGGIGKSTLVHNVYKNLVSNFDCRAWVSISQSYKLDDICRNMLRDILAQENKEFDAEKMDNAKLRKELSKVLDEKRYLIILDDIWKAEHLYEIMGILADNCMGSRVIITTRIWDVASAQDCCKIKIEPLGSNDAWLLFCRKAFPNIENHVYPPELLKCAKDIVEKCDGLPLALTAIGSLLSLKRSAIDGRLDQDWRLFCEQLITELHKEDNKSLNRVEKILNLSYKYLPSHLKNCFLYCAMFPEDYRIHRKRLIKLWIAEGFIEQNGASSLEDIAEAYIRELVRRSMLQVMKTNSFGRLKCLGMHDLVRELAIFQSKKECFGMTYDDTHGAIHLGLDSRRLSVLRCKNDIGSSINSSRIRTFMAFDTSMAPSSWSSFMSSESKYMAVLDLSGLPIETIPDSIGHLFNLRYMCLNNTKVKKLPKSITKLINLETLSLVNAECLTLPRGFANLKKLRYLLVYKHQADNSGRMFIRSVSMKAFEGLWNLTELRTLDEVQANKSFVAKLGSLSQLRRLCISGVTSSICAELCRSISQMNHLSRLEIYANNEDELLHLETLALPNPLHKLFLQGKLSDGTLGSPFLLTHGNALREMVFWWCQLVENPLPYLSQLSNLTYLELTRAYTGEQMDFHAGWFPNLKIIYLYYLPRVKQICIHEGALVSLEDLYIRGLRELREVPVGIRSLKCIKLAYFLDMHPEFTKNLESEDFKSYPDGLFHNIR